MKKHYLKYQRFSYRTSQKLRLHCVPRFRSKDVEDVLRKYWNEDTLELHEQFKILLLNRTNRVIGIFEVSSGGLGGTVADPKLIFGCALKAAASGIILAHYAKLYIMHTIIHLVLYNLVKLIWILPRN